MESDYNLLLTFGAKVKRHCNGDGIVNINHSPDGRLIWFKTLV